MTSVFTTTTAVSSEFSAGPVQAGAEVFEAGLSVVVTAAAKPESSGSTPRPIGLMAEKYATTSGAAFFSTDVNAAWRPLSPQNRSSG